MSEERARVLRMLKDGRITVEEAEALLEALGEEEAAAPTPAGIEAGSGARLAGDPAESGAPQPPVHDLIEEILDAVDVERIVDTVRESVSRSRAEARRVRDEVRRAAREAREEARRAAREARKAGWGGRIGRAIDGLWGLAGAQRAWAYDAELPAGGTVALHNAWGDVRLLESADGRLRARAQVRAWGRDEHEAQDLLEAVQVTVQDDPGRVSIKVERENEGWGRRFRADFEFEVPRGIGVEIHLAKGDVSAERIGGDVSVQASHGDVTLAEVGGRIEVRLAHGDVTIRDAGPVTVRTLHGDVVVEGAAGDVTVTATHGDIAVRRPRGPVTLRLDTTTGDVGVEVAEFVAGSASRISTVAGDIEVRLDRSARCRFSARVAAGEVRVRGPLRDVQRGRQSAEGVAGSPDATLTLAAVKGDVVLDAQAVDAPTPA